MLVPRRASERGHASMIAGADDRMPPLYQPIARLPVCARVPLLPLSRALETFAASSPERYVRGLLAESPICEAAIWAASPALWRAIRAAKPDSEPAVWASAARYVVRMASRCTPFGLFSAVAAVVVAPETTLRIRPGSRAASARIDRAAMAQLGDRLELSPALRASLTLYTNDFASDRAGASNVFSSSRSKPTLKRQTVEATTLVDLVRRRAKDGIQAAALRDALIETAGLTAEIAEATITALLDAGVLISDLPAKIFAFDDDAALELWARESPEAAAQVAMVRRTLARVNGAPPDADALDRYQALHEAVTAAFDVEKTAFQLDSSVTLDGALGRRVLDDVCKLAGLVLSSGTTSRGSDAVAKFIDAFEGEALVPLMELAGSKLLQTIVDLAPERKHAYTEDGHARLIGAIVEAIRRQTDVRFTYEEFLALLKPAERAELPQTVEIVFEIAARDADAVARGDYLLGLGAFGIAQNAARSAGRFMHLLPGQREALAAWYAEDEEDGALRAELVFRPAVAKLGAVLASNRVVTHHIDLGLRSDDAHHRISPRDLYVGVEAGAFYLWSRSLRRRIRITRHDMLSVGHFGSDVLTFLGMISALAPRSQAKLALGDADSLSYVPRIVVDRLVVSPARWTLGKSDANAEALERWRALYRVPRLVRIVENVDNTLLVDLDSRQGRDELIQALARGARSDRVRLTVEEALGAAQPWLSDGSAQYASEFVASLELAERRAVRIRRPLAAIDYRARGAESRGPDRGWLYFKVYCEGEDQDRVLVHVLRSLREEMVAQHGATRWFFLRYTDPRPHLRFRASVPADRVHAAGAAIWKALLERLRDGWIQDVEQAVYHPELARYGGPDGLAVAEEIFAADSARVLQTLASRPGEGARRAEAVLQAAELLDTMLDGEQIERWLAEPRRRQKLSPDDWSIVRDVKARLTAAEHIAPETRRFAPIPFGGKDDAHAGLMHFTESILHMHFNRYGFTRHDEHYLREMVWHARKGLSARTGAAVNVAAFA